MTTLEKILKEFEEKFGSSNGGAMPSGLNTEKNIKSFLTKVYEQARQETLNNCLNAVVEQRRVFSNTPLDQRGNGWDWLDKVHSALLSLKDKSK